MDRPFAILTEKDFVRQSGSRSTQTISSLVANPSSKVRRFYLPDEEDVEVLGNFLVWIDRVRLPENTHDSIDDFIRRCRDLLKLGPPPMRARDEDQVSKAPSYPSEFLTRIVFMVVDIAAPLAGEADRMLRLFLPERLALSTIAAKRTSIMETFQLLVELEEHVGNRIYAAGLFNEKPFTKHDQIRLKNQLRLVEPINCKAYEPLRPRNLLRRLCRLEDDAIEKALPGAIQSFSPYFVELFPSHESIKTELSPEQILLMELHDKAQEETVIMMEHNREGNRYRACAEFQTNAVKYLKNLKKSGADLGEPVQAPCLVKLRGKGSGCRADDNFGPVRCVAVAYFKGSREIIVSGQSLSWSSSQVLVFGRKLELPDDHYMFVHFQRFAKR